MDNPALIRVHRLKGGASSGTQRIVGQPAGELLEGGAALIPIIARIEHNTDIIPFTAIGGQTGQILQCVKSFTMTANCYPGHIPRKPDLDDVFMGCG